MSLTEMKARFRGYRRREEEREEARIMEHNRTVSELFTSVCLVNRMTFSCETEHAIVREANLRCRFSHCS